jgi:hypothetical protein
LDSQLIITHPGSAHFDEITAISLLLASFPQVDFRVERRYPSPAELDNPAVWVIDVGNRHEPAKRNFDHHQSLDCPAAFVLVTDYLGLLEAMRVTPWWNFKDYVDRIGPVKASAMYNAGDDLVNRSPMEDWFTNSFAADAQSALPVLKSYGENVISYAKTLKTQIDYWNRAQRLVIGGLPAVIGETHESFGLEDFRRLSKDPPDIVISMDRRSDGWRLYRYEGTQVNFYRLADSPEIEFAHKSGFMAKTKEHLPLEDLVRLIEKAVVKP